MRFSRYNLIKKYLIGRWIFLPNREYISMYRMVILMIRIGYSNSEISNEFFNRIRVTERFGRLQFKKIVNEIRRKQPVQV